MIRLDTAQLEELVQDTIALLEEMTENLDFYGPAAVERLLNRWREATR